MRVQELRRWLAPLAAVALAVGVGVLIGTSTSSAPTQAQSPTTTTASRPDTQTTSMYGDFVGESLLDFYGRPIPAGPIKIVRIPDYQPIGVIVSQFPSPDVVVGRGPFTLYLFVSSGPLRSDRQVLPLATGAPAHPECVGPVQPTEDGNVYPLLCRGNGVDVAAWDFYAESYAPPLLLGRHPTRCEALGALYGLGAAREFDGWTNVELSDAYELASAYYGWHFVLPGPGQEPPEWERSCSAAEQHAQQDG